MKHRIIKRNGESVGIISYKDSITKEYKQKWITTEQYETDRQLEMRMLEWMDNFEANDINNPAKITFGSFIRQWIDNRDKIADTTRDGYNLYIKNHIVPALGDIPLSKLKSIDVDKLYKDMAHKTYKKGEEKIPYSQNTILQVHAIIHKCLKYACKNHLIKDSPADFCENTPVHEHYQSRVYTEVQFKDLMKAVSGTIDEVYIILAGCMGMRRGEVLGLRWNDIDFKDKIIHVRKTKVRSKENGIIEKTPKNYKSIRDISVNDKTVQILKKWQKKKLFKSEFVCDEFNPNTYSGHFKLLLENLKLPHTRFHDLRHFAATFMLKSGVPDKVASERLGHSNVATTREIYQHVLKEMDREAAKNLDKLME